jgi:hypothetical protein
MGVTTKKYRVSVCFCRKLAIFNKMVDVNLQIFGKNLKILKTRKNSYT